MNSAAKPTKFKSCPWKNLPSVEKGIDERVSLGQEEARHKKSISLPAHIFALRVGVGSQERREGTNLMDTRMCTFHVTCASFHNRPVRTALWSCVIL